jgi:Protein tyrosine and serine/threonine kinase
MQNILVTDRYYPNDAQYPHEYDYIITDIGEGKVLSPEKVVMGPTNARSSYGAVDFRAPEVHGHTGWSTKAEVFSFGVIACKILDCKSLIPTTTPNWVLSEAREKLPQALTNLEMTVYVVPAGLKKVVEPCLSNLLEDRPSMKDTVLALDDVADDFTSDTMDPGGKRKIKWVYWNWRETLARGRKGTIERSHSREKQDVGGGVDNEEDENFEEFAKPMEID